MRALPFDLWPSGHRLLIIFVVVLLILRLRRLIDDWLNSFPHLQSVSVHVCLPDCVSICLFACMCVCQTACLCVSISLLACAYVYLSVSVSVYQSIFLRESVSVFVCLSMCLHACLSASVCFYACLSLWMYGSVAAVSLCMSPSICIALWVFLYVFVCLSVHFLHTSLLPRWRSISSSSRSLYILSQSAYINILSSKYTRCGHVYLSVHLSMY